MHCAIGNFDVQKNWMLNESFPSKYEILGAKIKAKLTKKGRHKTTRIRLFYGANWKLFHKFVFQSSTFKAEEGKSKNRKTFCFESPGSSQKSNPSQYIMGNESKNIVVMRKEGSLETIQIRGVSFSEDKEQSMKSSVMLKKRSKDSNSVVVDNEEQAETEDAFGSEDGDEGTLLKAFLTEEGKKLSEAMNLAKQLTLKIGAD